MAYSPIHLFNDDYVPDDNELEYCEHLILSRDSYTPAELITEARYIGVLKALLEHSDTAYLVPYYHLMKEAENLIRINYKDEFASFLSDNQDNQILHEILPALFFDICRYCSVSCATALFESQLHDKVNVHSQFVTNITPLEYAALHLSYDMTRILLHHGADPNRRPCYFHGYPLQTALTQLFSSNDYVKQWTKEKSVFKLFYILCLPELKEPLDTIRLLASHTKPIEEVCDNYIVAGCISKLIVLVMAARDDLLLPDEGSIETTRIWKYITRELSSNRLEKWSSRTALNETLMDARVKIETLWRAISVLERYRNSPRLKRVLKNDVPFHIAVDLMNDAGSELKLEDVLCDDMECMRPNLSSSIAIDFCKRIGLDKHSVTRSGLQRPLAAGVRKPTAGGSLFSSLSKSNFQREYHTFPAVNSNKLKPMETQLI